MTTFRRISPYVLTLAALAARERLEAAGTVTGVSAAPSPASAGAEVAVTVAGTGPCQVYLDFGDKQKAAHMKLLPGTVKHVYARPGTYVIKTFTYTSGNQPPGLSRCGGFADMELVVNPSGRSKAFAPAGKAAGGAAVPDKAAPVSASGHVKVLSGPVAGAGGVSNPAPAAAGGDSQSRIRTTPTPTPGPK